ncbi:hypothetical protein [Rhizosphaericola mali]|uniref:Uncharacterized protein n=1 Tax=Rhizosphaericola mali TaxID=2545455 RepID=A0A5P2G050_9BACT|nr:hypothetical protein [Rhizosphaericola mali]QES87170.1 hypothetical protein E0W69_000295 [Rhizosphaericola mali]
MAKLSLKYIRILFILGLTIFFSFKLVSAYAFTKEVIKNHISSCEKNTDNNEKKTSNSENDSSDNEGCSKLPECLAVDWISPDVDFIHFGTYENITLFYSIYLHEKVMSPIFTILTPPPDLG